MVRKSNGRSLLTGVASPGRPLRQDRRDARRDEILRAAASMFRARGFADTGMRDIADAARLSPANLYHYFRGKDEILFYCQDRALDRMLDVVSRTQRQRLSVIERLRVILASHVQVMLDEVEGATAHLQIDALPPALRQRIVAKRDRYERGLRTIIAAGVTRGECVAPDPALAARAMLGALNWTVTWFSPTGPRSAAEIGDDIAGFLVRGIAPETNP